MIIKYKTYTGRLIYAKQLKGDTFKFRIQDKEDVIIEFIDNMNEIRIANSIGNMQILSDIENYRIGG